MMRPADTIESNISFSFSIASTSTKHLGSKSKPSMSSLATSSWWHSALRLSMVIPSPGTTIAQSGLFWLTSNDTCEREMFVSKLVAPSSIMKGQLFAVRWIDSMYLKSGWSPRKGWQLKGVHECAKATTRGRRGGFWKSEAGRLSRAYYGAV
tara:strand:- start:334 stop:789 length:456 start_codon:yes stop_codon:yes gene_type:complete